MSGPRRDHWFPPTIGEDSGRVLDEAIASLGKLRGMSFQGDAGTTLHLLAINEHPDRQLPENRGCGLIQPGRVALSRTHVSTRIAFADGNPLNEAVTRVLNLADGQVTTISEFPVANIWAPPVWTADSQALLVLGGAMSNSTDGVWLVSADRTGAEALVPPARRGLSALRSPGAGHPRRRDRGVRRVRLQRSKHVWTRDHLRRGRRHLPRSPACGRLLPCSAATGMKSP